MSSLAADAKVGIVMTDTHISGTVRRLGNVFRALSNHNPTRYHLIVIEELYEWLNRAGYHLGDYANVHRLRPMRITSRLDARKWESRKIALEDAGRFLTLLNFRKQVVHVLRDENIRILQTALGIYVRALSSPWRRSDRLFSLASTAPL
jgi:hypothetical protein